MTSYALNILLLKKSCNACHVLQMFKYFTECMRMTVHNAKQEGR